MYYEVPAIYDELNASSSFDDFLSKLRLVERLRVKECIVSGKRTAHVTRNKTEFDPQNNLHDECGIVVVNEDYKLISKSINKIYKYGDPLGGFSAPKNNTPIHIEEYVPGELVTLSRVKNTYLISTKEDIHGRNYFPGTKASVCDIFLQKVNASTPRGLDKVYNLNVGLGNYCWSFIINKKSFGEYVIYLINCSDLDQSFETSPGQLDYMAKEVNLKRPKRLSVHSTSKIKEGADYIKKRSDFGLEKVVIINNENNRAFFMTTAEYNFAIVKRGVSKKLENIVEVILRNREHGKNDEYVGDKELFNFIEKSIDKLLYQNKYLYEDAIRSKSRKRFASKVSNSHLSKVLFALKDKKIERLEQVLNIMSKMDILRAIEADDRENFERIIKEFKNKNGY